MQVQFLIIDKKFADMNRGNKHVLMMNARHCIIVNSNAFISEKSYATITRIARKVSGIKDTETLLRKILIPNKDEFVMPSEIDRIDEYILNVESEVEMDAQIDKAVSKIKNFNPALN